jgi:hypothetical protein
MNIRRQIGLILTGAAMACAASTVNMGQIRGYSGQANPATYGLPGGTKVAGGVDHALDKADQYANMPRNKAVQMENQRHEAVLRRIDEGIAKARQKMLTKTGGCRRLPAIARESCEAGANSAFQKAFQPFEVARAQEMNLYRSNMARIQRLPV